MGYLMLEALAAAWFDGDGMHYFTAHHARELRSILARLAQLEATVAELRSAADAMVSVAENVAREYPPYADEVAALRRALRYEATADA